MATSHNSLRDRQIRSIERMLNLNHDSPETANGHDQNSHNGLPVPSVPILNEDGEPIWKVLVFDDLGRDVISSVLRVSDLRTWGVTMHISADQVRHIAANRHPIPDVPVLYLVEPTAANLQGITNDLSRGLYSPAYINFLSSIPRALLEDFAKQTAETGTSEHIAQFYDQYLNFIVAEPDLFSLGMRKENTYWALNSAKTKDEELDNVVDRIVSGLFSVMVTMGAMPIIRCPPGAAAEMISAKLDRKLRDHILNSKDNLFSAPNNRQSTTAPSSRPVLIILDRNVDLIPMLSHSWTYQSLVHDILNMKLNRITVDVPIDADNPSKGSTKKAYDLTANDFFWAKNAGSPFPQVAEDIDAELLRYREDAAEITKKTGASSIEDLQNDTSASAQHLKAAITLLPELRERKAVIDMHMNILTGLLQGVKDRQLDNYFQMEENIMKQTKAQMLEVLNDQEKGNEPMDKLRLFIIWYLSTEQEISRADMDKFEESLKAAGADTTSLAYIKQVRTTTRMTMLSTAPSQTSTTHSASSNSNTDNLFRNLTSFSSRLTTSLKDSGITSNVESLLSNVKNFLPANRDLTVTKITESLMDPSGASSSAIAKTENYLYFDPRSANARGTLPPASAARKGEGRADAAGGVGVNASFGMRRQGFSEGVVFMVGGGSMDEYGNLGEWVQRCNAEGRGGAGAKKRVVYGSTEVLSAEEFLKGELGMLGGEAGGG
ncbi:hypothetical protein CJF32_00009395 [Rutstroemia sp. NJR-2017a WRK4]|nr:hypothetical protein CJF32_00009395 [Rutstroemia sp. NJR-2017a WRK4]